MQVLQDPFDAVKSGDFIHVPVIMGTNKDEGNLFIYDYFSDSVSATVYELIIAAYVAEDYVDDVLELYPPIEDVRATCI